MSVQSVIYARFSPRPKNKIETFGEDSNDKQIFRCKEYAEKHGYEVSEKMIFRDDLVSGMDDEQNPDPMVFILAHDGLSAALQILKKGMVFLVWRRDRIAREHYIQLAVDRIVHAAGAFIESTEDANGDTMPARMYRSFKAEEAKDYAERIRFMTKMAMRKHQDLGRRMGRVDRCPFGFMPDTKDKARLVENPEEKEAIRIVIEKNKLRWSPGRICRHLDELGFRRRGKKWVGGRSTIRAIIARHKKNSPVTQQSDDVSRGRSQAAQSLPDELAISQD